MRAFIKDLVRKILTFLHLDVTRNLQYDRLTKKLIRETVKPGSVCIDVGSHKGEILELFHKYAPAAKHYAFEPIPGFFQQLALKYTGNTHVFSYALGAEPGQAVFQFVKNAPAYSGLLKRSYAVENPEIEEIPVRIETLDRVIPAAEKVDLIKIDVEGGEFAVLRGAASLIARCRPILIFECGLGASDHYGTDPGELFDFLEARSMQLYTLPGFFAMSHPLTKADFSEIYHSNKEYYFVAKPAVSPN